MNPGKIAKRLRREAVANPKKAAILGILVVVSLVFWIPLVRGWMKRSGEALTESADAVSAASPKTTLPGSATPTAENRPSWQEIERRMRDDPRTATAPPPAIARDPFDFPKAEVAATETKEKEEEKKPLPVITPSAAGLSLSGTIIGPRSRVAQINGKAYTVGQDIEVNDEKTAIQAAFKVMEVHPRRVILQSGKDRFELSLPEPGKSDKIDFHRPNQ